MKWVPFSSQETPHRTNSCDSYRKRQNSRGLCRDKEGENLAGNLDNWHDLCKSLKRTPESWLKIILSYGEEADPAWGSCVLCWPSP